MASNDRTHGVRLEVEPGKMTLLSDNPDLGRATEDVAIDGYDGEQLVIAFNARYMRDILTILSTEKVELALNESLSPGLFREFQSDDYLFVIMPMRI